MATRLEEALAQIQRTWGTPSFRRGADTESSARTRLMVANGYVQNVKIAECDMACSTVLAQAESELL